jgi:lipid-A-disaccharide synthase
MQAAGATMLQLTTSHAAMGAGVLKHAWTHRQWLKQLRSWLAAHPIDALVPTDSPAANWSICATVRKQQPNAKIVHLVAPQLWAWASWRIRRMRRLSDHVLCLLPFEPDWFSVRGVPGTFVGHPVFNEAPATPADPNLPAAHPRLALLPGSRTGELARNWPTMCEAFMELSRRHRGLQAVIAAASDEASQFITHTTEQMLGRQAWPANLHMQIAQPNATLAWADLVLVVSGTATLQVAAHQKPMVAMFNTSRWMWRLLGQFLVSTHTYALPNVVLERCLPETVAHREARPNHEAPHVIPEFIPHFGLPNPIVHQLDRLIREPAARQHQIDAMRKLAALFEGKRFAETASDALLTVIRAGR